jgi:endonuclease YncB( thermonuclease family)
MILAGGLLLSQPIVIDGDTMRDGAERYRIENIDAPETGWRAACPAEAALGDRATAELQRWAAGARRVEAFPVGRRDRYGRVVARVEIDGVDVGERLMRMGLAQRWRGRKANFCG